MVDDPEAESAPPDSLSGRVLAERYELQERLGEGGMGAVYRAHHRILAAPVALKLMDPEIARDPEALARFNREAQAAANLRSPHVVQILDYGVDGDQPFIAMELLEGETLAARLKRVGPLSLTETVRLISQMARAVGRAHEADVVHRDLKPGNVFIIQNEDEEVAKVLDFGIAKVRMPSISGESERTQTGIVLGTPNYMSPEQAQGVKEVDHRSDIWSLGVIAYECMTGQKAFDSGALGDLVLRICVGRIPVPSDHADVPAGFDAWFARAVHRDLEQRFQSARELAEALRVDVAGEEPSRLLTAPPPSVANDAPTEVASGTPPPAEAAVLSATEVSPVVPEPPPGPTERSPASAPTEPALADSTLRRDEIARALADHGRTRADGGGVGLTAVLVVAGIALAAGAVAGVALYGTSPAGSAAPSASVAAPRARAGAAPSASVARTSARPTRRSGPFRSPSAGGGDEEEPAPSASPSASAAASASAAPPASASAAPVPSGSAPAASASEAAVEPAVPDLPHTPSESPDADPSPSP